MATLSNYTYKIPQDVAYDVLRTVISNKVPYKIAGIREKENLMLLEVYYSGAKPSIHAQDGIESILNDYKEYMKDIVPDQLIVWDEDDDNNED